MIALPFASALSTEVFEVEETTVKFFRENFDLYGNALLYPLAAVLISGILTLGCIHVLPKLGYIDVPHGRHMHTKPTPRGGGIAIAVTFLVIAWYYSIRIGLLRSDFSGVDYMTRFSIPASIILIVGIIDDRIELSSIVKLLAQVTAAVLIYFLGGGFYSFAEIQLPMWIGIPLTIVWVVGIINAFNLIDGLDGLAAGLACISSATLVCWYIFSGAASSTTITLIFLGSCLGFLRYNFHPAKIFMGDTGSTFIGLFFAYSSSIQVSRAVSLAAVLLPLLAMGVPLFDITLAVWRRVVRKWTDPENTGIMTGDHDHLHHRIKRKTNDDRKTAWILYGIAMVFGLFSLVPMMLKVSTPIALVLMVLVVMMAVARLANVEMQVSANYLVKGIVRPSKRSLLVQMHPIFDLLMLWAAYLIAFSLIYGFRANFLYRYSFVILAPFVVCFVVSGVYRTFWLRSSINRYFLLLKAFLLASAIGFLTFYALYHTGICVIRSTPRGIFAGYLLFSLLALFFIGTERFLMRYLESFGVREFYLRAQNASEMRRTLIIGGGIHCRLYLNWLFCHCYNGNPTVITGIVDDDHQLRHWNVYGFPVLGSSDELEEIFEQHPVDSIVITAGHLTGKVHERIVAFCNEHNIKISYFIAQEHDYPPENFIPEKDDEEKEKEEGEN